MVKSDWIEEKKYPPLRRTRLDELRFLNKFDKDMYHFLSNIPNSKMTKKITSINDLTEVVKILENNEERFWFLFSRTVWL